MSKVQELNFELMKLASFNEFDGEAVVKSLTEHSDLWSGAVMGRFGYSELIQLRDIPNNSWNVDTLMILSSGEDDQKLEELAKTWGADEVDWLSVEQTEQQLGSYPAKHKVLRIWWD